MHALPLGDAALAGRAGFTEVSRMSRQPRTVERFRRGHFLLRLRPPARRVRRGPFTPILLA
jgi:hypothetical protein